MRKTAIIPLVIGLAVGLVAIKMGIDVVKRAQGASGRGDAVEVVVASKTIPVASEITEHMVTTARTARSLVPRSSFSKPQQVIGRVTKMAVAKGLPVLASMLAPVGTSPGMPSRIPDGYRAVSVKVDEESQVGGFLKPGCRVDVAAVLTVRAARRTQTISRVILQDVEVAAVGQSLSGDQSGANLSRSVTLLVKPQDVPKLHLAASKGKIRLAMRNQLDQSQGGFASMSERALLEGSRQQGRGLSLLGGLLGRLLAGRSASSSGPQQMRLAMAEEPRPWLVELCLGGQFRPVVFRGPDSMDRIGANGLDGPTFGSAAAGRSRPALPRMLGGVPAAAFRGPAVGGSARPTPAVGPGGVADRAGGDGQVSQSGGLREE